MKSSKALPHIINQVCILDSLHLVLYIGEDTAKEHAQHVSEKKNYIILSQYQFQDDGIKNAKLQLQLDRWIISPSCKTIYWAILINQIRLCHKIRFLCHRKSISKFQIYLEKKWMFITKLEWRKNPSLISTKHNTKVKNSKGIILTSFCWKTNMLRDNIPVW